MEKFKDCNGKKLANVNKKMNELAVEYFNDDETEKEKKFDDLVFLSYAYVLNDQKIISKMEMISDMDIEPILNKIKKCIKDFKPTLGAQFSTYLSKEIGWTVSDQGGKKEIKSYQYRKLINMIKLSSEKMCDINIKNLTADQYNTLLKELKVTKKTLDAIIEFYIFKKGQKSFDFIIDEETETTLGDSICDKSQNVSNDYEKAEEAVAIYEYFKYLFHHSKEKKHDVFRMINTNLIYKIEMDPKEYLDYIHALYENYLTKYYYTDDKNIILFHYFNGDRNPEISEYNSKKSNFSRTYRNEYNEIIREFERRRRDDCFNL